MNPLGVRAADLEARSYSDMIRVIAPDESGS